MPAPPAMTRRATLAALAGAAALRPARAGLPVPAGPVVLTVAGDVAEANAPEGAVFDDAMLGALPQAGFATATLWTGRMHFEGPPLAAVLRAVGAGPGRIEATALNDYRVPIDRALIEAEAPILARRIDGAPFGVRARGPLWIMFPFDDRADFRREVVYTQCVWQLAALRIAAG